MKNLNRGYVGRKQSKRADIAIKNGECPLSMLTRRKLDRHGVSHSAAFVVWLCKQGYIRYTSRHHRGNPPVLTRFYHPADIRRQLECLAVDLLLEEWKATWATKKHGWSKKEQKHG